MRTKTVYMLRIRPSDDVDWWEAEEFETRRKRKAAASFVRVLLGFRTYSYEERRAVAEKDATGQSGSDRRER